MMSRTHKPFTRMLVVGLTGGIGAGKTAVARALEAHGAFVSDSDKSAKELLTTPQVRDTLVAWWGPEILGADGQTDRAAIAKLVFSDEAKRKRLERLIHPLLHERRSAERTNAQLNRVPFFVIDAPLLIEAGLDKECDAVVFVDAPRPIRLARVQTKRGWDEAELARREAAQLTLEEKRAQARHIVINDGDAKALHQQVAALVEKLKITAMT
jgi:dephospho-CoA kinase